jgi:hypothetical protein
MPSAINADNGVVSGTAGLKSSADNSGVLDLQTNGTTAISISASQVVTFANQPAYTGGTANGVLYLNASKVLTSGSALTFDGSKLTVKGGNAGQFVLDNANEQYVQALFQRNATVNTGADLLLDGSGNTFNFRTLAANMPFTWNISATAGSPSERMRLDSAGNLGLGTIPSAWGGPFDAMQLGTYGQHIAGQTNTADLKIGTNNYYNGSNYVYTVTGYNAMQIQLGQGVFNVSAAPAGTAGATASLTQIIGVAADQSVALQGATSQSGAGITFPATQSASSNANTLDDYEEGSWTPSLRDGGTNRSPSYAHGPTGTYVKIGRFVFVRWGFKLSNKGAGSGSGEIQIFGLPFTPTSTGSYQEENVSVSTGALNTAANAGIARMVVNTSSYVFGRVANNGDTVWTYNDLTNDSWIIGELCYIATA